MRRHILGVVTATVAAPYLTILLWELSVLLLGEEVGIEEPIDLLKAIPIGTFAFLLFGLPLLILSSVFAILVNTIENPSWRSSVFSGAILGLGFMSVFFVRSPEYSFEVATFLTVGTLTGAICGWIYWRIALSRAPNIPSPASPHEVHRG